MRLMKMKPSKKIYRIQIASWHLKHPDAIRRALDVKRHWYLTIIRDTLWLLTEPSAFTAVLSPEIHAAVNAGKGFVFWANFQNGTTSLTDPAGAPVQKEGE